MRGELDASLRGAHLAKAAPGLVAGLQPFFADRVPALLTTHKARRHASPNGGGRSLSCARSVLGRTAKQRLVELRRVNPTLPQAEVERHARKMAQTLKAIEGAE